MSGSRAGAPLEFSWRQYLAMTPSTAIEANDGGISFYSSLELFPPRLRLVSTCSDRAATCWVSLYLCSQPSLFHFHSVVSSTILTVLTLLIDVDPPKI